MAGKRERGGTTRRRARGAGTRSASGRRVRSTGRRLFSWFAAATIWAGIGLVALVGWYAYDLPQLSIEPPTRQPSITLLAADGTRFASFGPIYGKPVALGALPSYLPEAVLAVEDRRFYSHPGVDPLGVLRALYVNIEAGRIVQGGSTITQQLAKNLFLSPDRTLKRKVQELLLAFWLEWRFTKDQILTLYLNRVYLGAGTHGVDAASWHYFSKPARELSLYEAAMLAGLLKAPSRFNPATDRGRADQRAALVLAAMADAGYISAEEAERVAHSNTKARGRGGVGRYFADWVWTLVPGYVGNANEDLLVQTTLDLELQQIVSEEFAALLEAKSSEAGVSQGAVVVLDPSGAVRAMLGGSDHERSQFNRATQALRQPGSAFKPFIYLAALEAGYEPDSRMVDAPVRVEDWAPKNYNNRYFGEVTLREAFARSLNSVAVQLSERVGRERVAAGARRLGITSELEVIPSIALGTSEVTLLELSGAYAAFANQGYGVFPYAVEKVTTSSGRLIYLRQGTGPGRVVDPQAAAAMNDLMTATVVWGSGKAAKLERPVAGKTGTSQDFRDAWFLGYTADYVGGVWFGNDDGKPMNAVSGSTLPAVLWGRIMARAHEGLPVRPIGADAQLMASVEEPAVTGESEQSGGFLERLITRLLSGEEESEEAVLRERRLRGSPMPKPERGR